MINKVILVGFLGSDPTPREGSCTQITVATSNTTKRNGKKQEITEWHNILIPPPLAASALEHLKKGSKVYIDGSMQSRQLEKNGVRFRSWTVICHKIVYLSK